MDPQEAKKEIERLTQSIKKYNNAFFQESTSLISDYDFDQLMARLAHLEELFPMYKKVDSPTCRVGESTSKLFLTIVHKRPMYSLSNTYRQEDLLEFINKTKKKFPEATASFVCELKLDGVALSLIYKKGTLKHIITRGDGMQGDDITANGQLLQHLPWHIDHESLPDSFEVRGEAFMPLRSFHALNKRYIKEGKPALANPRNATSGLIRTKIIDEKLKKEQPLAFSPYGLLGEHLSIDNQKDALLLLQEAGFHLSSAYQHCNDINEVTTYINYWEKERKKLTILIDGIVIKVNKLTQQQALGMTSKSPRWAIAYKYQPASIATSLLDVSFHTGRTGVITPVAVLAPIHLAGTTVQRATLYNAQEIKRLDLCIGDTVFIEKGGEIIPKITHIDYSKRSPTAKRISFVTTCPTCYTALECLEGEAKYYCPNTFACPTQLKGQIAHFVQRKALNIASIGPKTIDLLFENNLIKQPVDLFYLRPAHIASLKGFQQKSIQNLIQGIEKAKKTPFGQVLFGLGIRHVGFTVAQKLTEHFKEIRALMLASKEELLLIPEIGEKIADSLIAYFNDKSYRKQLSELERVGVALRLTNRVQVISRRLTNMIFVVSGTLKNYSREGIKRYIKEHGGKTTTSLSAKTTFLVIGNNPSRKKLAQAKELNVRMISEEVLEEMI